MRNFFYRFCLSVSSSSWPCSTFFDSFLSVPKSSKIITEVSCTPTASILRGKVILPQMLWTVLCAKSGNWYLDDLEFAFVLIWTQNCTENWRRGSTLYQARNSCLIFSLGFFHVSPELFQDCISSSQMIRPISDAIRPCSAQKRYVTSSKLSYASAGNEKNLLCAFLLEKLWSFRTPWGFSLIGIALKNPYFAPFFQRNFLALIPCL